MTAHDPRVTLTEAEREAIWAGLRRARHEEAPIPLAHEFHKTHVLWAVGPAVEQIIAARLAPIRVLADRIGDHADWSSGPVREVYQEVRDSLRAALDAPVSASQDHHGAEGQGADLDRLCRRLEAWIRHGEAVPSDVTTYDRQTVHDELRLLIEEARRG